MFGFEHVLFPIWFQLSGGNTWWLPPLQAEVDSLMECCASLVLMEQVALCQEWSTRWKVPIKSL